MSYLLKDLYSPAFYNRFTNVVKEVLPSFDKLSFTQLIFAGNWKEKELKDRMKHTSQVLHRFLPGNFEKAAGTIKKIITQLRQNGFSDNSLEFMFFPDYIETFGIDHFEVAMKSIEFVTQFTSCEFAVRPFMLRYGNDMIQQMQQWSLHENHKVRRLASEGTRPRLPWAMAIPFLKKDPSPILPLLNNLKNDPHEWVRKSVANSLNDISKDHPAILLSIARQWKGISTATDAIIKHGSRTLLKQGHAGILQYYGLHNSEAIAVSGFSILTPKVTIGKHLEFSFAVQNTGNTSQTVRLEYGVYYVKQNKQLSKKVFKISERLLQPKEKLQVVRKQSFKPITTRTFYTGKHKVSVIINGQERKTGVFELVK